MGNRLARSPKKNRAATVAAVVATEPIATTPLPDAATKVIPSVEATVSLLPHVVTTIHAVDAFKVSTNAVDARQSQPTDPTQFFALHGSVSSVDDTDDVAIQYAQALLLLHDGHDVAAVTTAMALLRPLAMRPVVAPLAADARIHLARCLLLLDPALDATATATETERLLCESEDGEVSDELGRNAKELLAYVRLAGGDVDGVEKLLEGTTHVTTFQRVCAKQIARTGTASTVMDATTWTVSGVSTPLDYELLTDAEALVVGLQ